MQVTHYSDPSAFDALRADWNALLKRSSSDVIFLRWEFQKTWWDHLGADYELRLLAARADTGELLGLAPLYVDREQGTRVLRLVGGLEVADYLDFILAREQHDEALAALLDALAQQDDWHALDLRNLPAASPTRRALAVLAAERQWQMHEQVEEVCPIIPLPASFEDYLATLDKKQRHEVRRKLRKAQSEAQIDCYVVSDAAELDASVEQFIALHQRSTRDKGEFMTAAMQGFFRALARRAFEVGWLELSFVAVNGQRAASYFNFAYGGQTLCYNSGYDPEAHAALSPGIVLLAYLIERAIGQRHTHFDFLQGNETYKYRMGAHDTQVYQLRLTRG